MTYYLRKIAYSTPLDDARRSLLAVEGFEPNFSFFVLFFCLLQWVCGWGVVVSLGFCVCFGLVFCFGLVLGVLVVATLACCVASFVDVCFGFETFRFSQHLNRSFAIS